MEGWEVIPTRGGWDPERRSKMLAERPHAARNH